MKGFTLLELIIVIGITMVIGVTAVPFYSRFFTQNAVANTVDQLAAELRKAQMYSMTSKKTGQWGVAFNNSTITMFNGASYAARNTTFDEKFSVDSPVTISGFTEVTFTHGTGTPSAVQSITVLGNNNSRIISVNALGVVNK
ncbi:MAG TPA: hypothetical protein VLG12_02145 [Candidatus Saccharimonadales bacterium]|nr:hypothetical protein [Candidatus Saccharimonadales bacterium]